MSQSPSFPARIQHGVRRIPFLEKLAAMLEDDEPVVKDHIKWSEDGQSIVVQHLETIGEKVLSRYFRSSNFSSFQRCVPRRAPRREDAHMRREPCPRALPAEQQRLQEGLEAGGAGLRWSLLSGVPCDLAAPGTGPAIILAAMPRIACWLDSHDVALGVGADSPTGRAVSPAVSPARPPFAAGGSLRGQAGRRARATAPRADKSHRAYPQRRGVTWFWCDAPC